MSQKTRPYRFEQYDLPPDFPYKYTVHPVPARPISMVHSHNVLEIGYCFSGRGFFLVESKTLPFSPGCVSIITHHEMHLARSVGVDWSDWAWIFCDPVTLLAPWCRSASVVDTTRLQGPDFPNVLTPESSPLVCSLVKDLVAEGEQRREHLREAIMADLLRLFVQLSRTFPSRSSGERSADTVRREGFERLRPAVEEISLNYSEQLVMKELAKKCNMSERSFFRHFSTCMGKTPHVYINELRISMACLQLKNTDHSVSRVALDNGFPTFSAFNRVFRKQTGCRPLEWRKKNR